MSAEPEAKKWGQKNETSVRYCSSRVSAKGNETPPISNPVRGGIFVETALWVLQIWHP